MIKKLAVAPLFLALSVSTAALAANSAPMAVPITQTVPDAQDVAYPGTMTLDIDASDTVRRAYRVTQVIPVADGAKELILLFPQWLPGNHGPRGPLAELVGVQFMVDGKPVEWKRDRVEVFAFHLKLPAGAKAVTAKFIHTSPLDSREGRITMTPEMLNLQWEKMSLYPAGHYVRRIRVKPTVTLPQGWTPATALDGMSMSGNRVTWAETDYETLVDSPIFAGRYFKKWDLGQKVTLNVVADKPEQLAAKPEHIAAHAALVEEAKLAFGANHFDHYEFLLALSDKIGGIGLEHHRSSENQLEPDAFIAWDKQEWDRNLLPHEYAHSWSGKFRRPARLWTPDYRQPMQGDLLWTYEGQDQFWGLVLAGRSGMQGKDMVLGMLAAWAGGYTQQPGREWRSVEDTGFDPVFGARKPKPFASLARSEDYYTEGALVWLEIDQILREGTGCKKSIDDFAKAFFGMNPGDYGQIPFEVDEIVTKLNALYPYDWAKLIDTRINQPGQPAPLNGITKGGYRLVWKEEPNPYTKAGMEFGKGLNLNNSIGLSLDKDGKVTGTRWDGPAFNAGIVTGAQIMAVNGMAYGADTLKKAITAAKGGTNGSGATPIDLLVKHGDRFDTIRVDYKDGLRYPWLERVAPGKAPVGLDLLFEPKRPVVAPKK
ncbi:MAG: peptidase M61 [Novosphingobium sp. 28-62-57]|uniref:M61 family metallopeptidase n=1 Tax=unclassified Novosphingobium TaxID=2644732 RepID=UPI000BDC7660|nr:MULTISPECIES: peptidase M61 [unclassified Novosphingobium]OYW50611.1 MAG: peptidase M61 [Novosphingobium sp. 12-62-10]OYZ11793.1 MAG: peptidase M61 [Novosphingobium sp. 28-62-57]